MRPNGTLLARNSKLNRAGQESREQDGSAGACPMTRRELLKALLAAGIWTTLKNLTLAAQTAGMKNIQELQKNWKALLAEGVKAPLTSWM